MKRFAGLMVLIALTTPAHAGSYTFVIHGHRIHVEASRHCRSLSCVSWTDVTKTANQTPAATPAPTPTPVAAVAPVAAPTAPVVAPAAAIPAPVPAPRPPAPPQALFPPAPPPQIAAPAQAPPPPPPPSQIAAPMQAPPPPPTPVQQAAPVVYKPVLIRAVPSPAPQTSPVQPEVISSANAAPKPGVGFEVKPETKAEPKPSVGFDLRPDAKLEPRVEIKPDPTASVGTTPAEKPPAAKPAVVAKPVPSKTSLESEGEGIEAPIGDWQTEGHKGLVRIEPCGTALCGYMINATTGTRGETVLINMKPKSPGKSEWTGSIYSRASGNTYYATMSITQSNTLRVEACVVGHYFCSGNDWTRLMTKSGEAITTREASAQAR